MREWEVSHTLYRIQHKLYEIVDLSIIDLCIFKGMLFPPQFFNIDLTTSILSVTFIIDFIYLGKNVAVI